MVLAADSEGEGGVESAAAVIYSSSSKNLYHHFQGFVFICPCVRLIFNLEQSDLAALWILLHATFCPQVPLPFTYVRANRFNSPEL